MITTTINITGSDLFRYKGILNVQGFSKKFVFQGVHMLFDGNFTEDWKEGEKRESKFVFIGRNLDHDVLTKKFLACTAVVDLRFKVGDKVYANTRGGSTLNAFDKGTIIKLWDEGKYVCVLLLLLF